MPELPEVERVRLTLAQRLVGREVTAVELRRADVVRGGREPADLLAEQRFAAVERLGKQLALVAGSGRCVCVHLGMTGSLRYTPPGDATPIVPHVHVIWRLDDGGTLSFRDPRRFGGVWTFPDRDALLEHRWRSLGEDALRITPARLRRRLVATRRPLKAALLDQNLVAGLGNIYVDELLFACGLHPLTPANALPEQAERGLVGRMRRLLGRAIEAGGSSLRDYVDGNGTRGGFQDRHRVYGRAGLPCHTCGEPLASTLVAGRTTVWCTTCQPAAGELSTKRG